MRTQRCALCDITENLEQHHVIPRSLGGSDEDKNILTVCSPCHGVLHSMRRSASMSALIRGALAAKKARGEPVGNPSTLQPLNGARSVEAAQFAAKLQPTISAFIKQGLTQREIVAELNGVGVRTAKGGSWGLIQLQRVISRA